MANDIDSDKIFIKNAFSWWYRVPDYQRPYIWGSDQVVDLLDDVSEWMSIRPDSEYFLGSIVLQERQNDGVKEHDLLDGQQRLSTCLMIFSVIRDITTVSQVQTHCRNAVFQQEDTYNETPERLRIVYDIREDVVEFVNRYIKSEGGTNEVDGLKKMKEAANVTIANMANALLEIRDYFSQQDAPKVEDFFRFFWNKVLLIYVSSPDLDDAFRMFTVLNDRGMKLRGSDILKTSNLRVLREGKASDEVVRKWAQKWEEWEGDLGDGFDIFLSQIRAVLVKDKARLSLLQEFDENIYAPRSFDRATKTYNKRKPLLNRGLDTFSFIERYYSHYQELLGGNNYHLNNSYEFDNLISLLQNASLADFWLPPVLRYYDVFGEKHILDFLKKLEAKFCGDWVSSETPTDRITAMNKITVAIDEINEDEKISNDEKITKLLAKDVFKFKVDQFRKNLEEGDIYKRRYARYLLFKLDALYGGPAMQLQIPLYMSVEHILPQNPKSDSKWCKDFSDKERELWTNRIGNLVLISRRKNASQGRMDFAEKKENYFKKYIETFPNSIRVIQKKTWDMETLKENHKKVVDKLCA